MSCRDRHHFHGLVERPVRHTHPSFTITTAAALLVSSWFLMYSVHSGEAAASGTEKLPKLLLISLDGFGCHFLSKLPKSKTPNFQAVMEKGVHVRWVENVFPTKTLPNHMSLVSGLYPESHGIVNNKFFDPKFNASMPRRTDPSCTSKWVDLGAEPIWVTNSKAGQGRRSGTVFWPCSEVRIKGRLPDQIKKEERGVSSEDITYNQRIDIALNWLTEKRVSRAVNFAAVYTHGVDGVSHKFGPDLQEMLDAIVDCDKTVGHLLAKVKEKGVEEDLNVIITADHGHSPIYPQLMVNIDKLLDPSWYSTYPDINARARLMVNLWPKKGYYKRVVKALEEEHLNLHVAFKRPGAQTGDLVSMHYSNNRRIAPVVLYAEPGWVIGRTNATFKSGKGEHGWDPRFDPFMYPMFMAMGPAFKKGVHNAEPFSIVDIYPLMCHLLGLEPAPNNGSLSRTAHILMSPSASVTESVVSAIIVGVVFTIVTLAVILIVVWRVQRSQKVSEEYKLVFTREGSAEHLVEDGKVVISDEEEELQKKKLCVFFYGSAYFFICFLFVWLVFHF